MVFSLLSYFVFMIMVLTAAVGTMIGLSNFSTSGGVLHYPRPVAERNVTATNTEPRLFMSVPETKGAASAKNIETTSTVVPTEKADAKKTGLTSPKCSPVSATTSKDAAMGTHGVMPKKPSTGYSGHFPAGKIPVALLRGLASCVGLPPRSC